MLSHSVAVSIIIQHTIVKFFLFRIFFKRKFMSYYIHSYQFLRKTKKNSIKMLSFRFTWIHSPGTESFLDTIVILHENVDKVTTTELPILFTKSFHDPPSSLFCPFLHFFFFLSYCTQIYIHEEGYVIIKTSNLMTMLFLITLHYDDIIISLCSNKDKYTACTQLWYTEKQQQ